MVKIGEQFHAFISELSSEKLEETFSWFSNTANVNTKTFDNAWSAAVPVELLESLRTVCSFYPIKCTGYSRDDLTLSVKIYSVSWTLFQNYPQRNINSSLRKSWNFLLVGKQAICFNLFTHAIQKTIACYEIRFSRTLPNEILKYFLRVTN